MLREFVQLVSEAVDEGFERGINLFMEGLEEDLAKSEVLAEVGGIDPIVADMFNQAGIEVEVLEESINEDEIDEEKLDAAIMQLKEEGILG